MTLKTSLSPFLLTPLTSNHLEKLPLGSLNTISEQVRNALLKVLLPMLCSICKSKLVEACKTEQSAFSALKSICEECKSNFIKFKRSTTQAASIYGNNDSVFIGSKPKQQKNGAKRSQDSKLLMPTPLTASPKDGSKHQFTLPITPPPYEGNQHDEVHIVKKKPEEIFEDLSPDQPIFESLDQVGGKWCRYCGTTGGYYWKEGPWGPKTLCNKHGCEYLGCGFAKTTSNRIDLSSFQQEPKEARKCPIIQEYCAICWKKISQNQRTFRKCHGCPFAFHEECYSRVHKLETPLAKTSRWYCSDKCCENFRTGRIRVNFSSKAVLPFLKKIDLSSSEQEDDNLYDLEVPVSPSLKLRINLSVVKAAAMKRKADEQLSVAKKRKYLKRDINIVDRVIVSAVPVKVDHSVHKHDDIFVPRWLEKSVFEKKRCQSARAEPDYADEDLSDETLLKRHSRYEYVERHMRLLQPGILDRLKKEGNLNK